MRFVRAVWKLLVGVKDALVLIFMLIFFGFLYAALSTRPAPIKDGVLVLDLDGTVVEQPTQAAFADVLSGSRLREYRLRDLIAALDEAKDDDRVKAVALDLDSFLGGGQTAIGDLGDAVRRVRASGKPVLAYATGYSDDGYQLASNASEIWLNPMGAVAIAGPGGKNLYFKGLMDKLGITANVYRVGTLQIGGRALHPQRHVARSARELPGAGGGVARDLAPARHHARGPRRRSMPIMRDPVAALDAGGGNLGAGGADRQDGRQIGRAARVRSAAGRAWRRG